MRKLLVLFALLAVSPAFAAWTLYDITADPTGWANALAAYGLVAGGGWDFDRDADYPIVGINGPVDYQGKYPISPGTIDFTGVQFWGRDYLGNQDLVTVGPSYGYGNVDNALLANYFVDAFVMNFQGVAAVEFNALSLLGTNAITIKVGADQWTGKAAPPQGHKWGLIAAGGAVGNFQVILEDVGGGAEGIQGWGQVYIPEPASLALLGLAALVLRRR